jgi:hypothetical protein
MENIMISKTNFLFLSALFLSSSVCSPLFASDSVSDKLIEAIEKSIALGYYKVTEVVTDKDNQEAVKKIAKDGYNKTKASYEIVTGTNNNKKLKEVLVHMGFSTGDAMVRDVSASYRYLPELANILAEAKVDVYQIAFDQLINNNVETKREFRKCTLIVEKNDDKFNYTLSSCLITTKNYAGAAVPSNETIISQDNDQAILITHQILNTKFSENIN